MNFRKILHGFRRNKTVIIFTACWLLSMLAGVLLASLTDPALFAFIKYMPDSLPSAAGILFTAALPLLTATAVSRFCPRYLIAVTALRAFAFAYTAMAIHIVFSTAGWLLCILLQFGAICSLPPYCWFCIRRLCGRAEALKTDLLICCSFTVAIAAVDLYLIAPLLISIAAL